MAEVTKAEQKAAEKEAKARHAALEAAMTQIDKDFGAGTLMRLTGNDALKVDSIPTGALSLDLALGVGGVPRGRVIEIFGPESSGKTTLVYHIIAEAQARGGVCAFIDAEHALDPAYARRIGVNTDELLISQPDYGEQALEIVDVLVRSGAMDVVAVDSVAALTPRVELEGQMGDQSVGLQARMMSQAMRFRRPPDDGGRVRPGAGGARVGEQDEAAEAAEADSDFGADFPGLKWIRSARRVVCGSHAHPFRRDHAALPS